MPSAAFRPDILKLLGWENWDPLRDEAMANLARKRRIWAEQAEERAAILERDIPPPLFDMSIYASLVTRARADYRFRGMATGPSSTWTTKRTLASESRTATRTTWTRHAARTPPKILTPLWMIQMKPKSQRAAATKVAMRRILRMMTTVTTMRMENPPAKRMMRVTRRRSSGSRG